MTHALMDAAKKAAQLAQKKGAQNCAAVAYQSRQVDVTWRDGEVEKLTEATTRGLGIALYVDGRYSSVSTNDMRPDALDRFVEEAIALTRTLAPDPHRQLPNPERYTGQTKADLKLLDDAHDKVTAAERRDMARALEVASRAGGQQHINSVTTSVGDAFNESARVHTNGFEGMRADTSYYMGSSVSVQDADGRRPQGHHYATTRFFKDLPPLEGIAKEATQRAAGRLGAKKMPSMNVTMAVENRAGGSLLGRLLGPLGASAIQQKRSFFEGRLGTQVGSALLHITDNPWVEKGLASRVYDSEGMTARPMPLFEAGTVRNAFVDNYYGHKLGWQPTSAGPSNLQWKLGTKDQAQLLADLKNGVLVTGFLGGNSNGTTGDFSLGVEGFMVRDGKIAEPVAEMNVAGNHLEFWKRLAAVGNDPYAYSTMGTPTLVFEGVQLAGL